MFRTHLPEALQLNRTYLGLGLDGTPIINFIVCPSRVNFVDFSSKEYPYANIKYSSLKSSLRKLRVLEFQN